MWIDYIFGAHARRHGGLQAVRRNLGQWDAPIVPDPAFVSEADVIVCESTYGDTDHGNGDGQSIDDALTDVIQDTVRRGGKLLIPTFALERAQELLVHLGEILHAKRVPRLPVFLDSPLAVDATKVYLRYPEFMDDEIRATLESIRLEDVRGLLQFVHTTEESKALNTRRGSCIILSGSGMCTGGRIKHHLRHNIEHPETTILFVGYQAEGTYNEDKDLWVLTNNDLSTVISWVAATKAKLPQHLTLELGRQQLNRIPDYISIEHGSD